MSEQVVCMDSRVADHDQQVKNFQRQIHGESTIGEVGNSFAKMQRDMRHTKEHTMDTKMTAFNRWEGAFIEAGIENAQDLHDSARIGNFFDVVESMFDDGRLQKTSGIVRLVGYLAELLKCNQVDEYLSTTIVNGVRTIVSEQGIRAKHTQPYRADDIGRLMTETGKWVRDRSTAPSLNGKKGDGQRKRAPSEMAVKRLNASVHVASSTGARVSGLLSIRLEDLDLDGGYVTYFRSKGKMISEPIRCKIADYSVGPIRDWVEFILAKRPNATHLFCGDNGKQGPCTETSLTRPLQSALLHLGIIEVGEKAGFHRFRSSIAYTAFKEGEDIVYVSAGLRHQNMDTTKNVYGHMALDDMGDRGRSHWLVSVEDHIESIDDAMKVEPVLAEMPDWEYEEVQRHITMIQALKLDAALEMSKMGANIVSDGPKVTEMKETGCVVEAGFGNIGDAIDLALKMGQHSADIHAAYAQVQDPSLSVVSMEEGRLVSRDATTGKVTHIQGDDEESAVCRVRTCDLRVKRESLEAVGDAAKHCLAALADGDTDDAAALLEMLSIWGACA